MKKIIKKFIPFFAINWYHFLLAFFGAAFHGFPSNRLTIIGVTGTNGKSTVVEFTAKILEKAGYKVASLSSIRFKIKNQEEPNLLKMTMPGRFKLQKFLRKAVNSGCQYAVIEVTSEGILQYRHKFIGFDIVIFTNLTPEHIEAHGSFENYKEAKGKLFKALRGKKISIVNLDDEAAKYFLDFPAKEKYGYSLEQNGWQPSNGENEKSIYRQIKAANYFWMQNKTGVSFEVEKILFNLNLPGEFNIYNALAAICVGLSQGISLDVCKLALNKIEGIPGRMELVIQEPFKVFVDYAFTPAALEKVYKTIRKLRPESQNINPEIICVLGAAGGGRDKWKRPVLGKIASQYCDQVFITNEDPYDENPMRIIEEVANGIKDDSVAGGTLPSVYRILDRKEAIGVALRLAEPGDVLINTGKGSEPWMCVAGGRKIPWDDKQIVSEELQNLKLWKRYETLEHKADLKIRAFGKTQRELFYNMLSGMGENMKPEIQKSEKGTKRKIKITSIDLQALLVDFLSEVLYLSQTNKEVYLRARFWEFSDKSLEGEIMGQKVKSFGEIIT